jgi:hypothetical protein
MGNKDNDDDTNNGAILATTGIMKAVLSSASGAEIGALFDNCKRGSILHTTLVEMGYPQPATPVQTDNSTACGIANDNIKQQRSRAIDMCFYCPEIKSFWIDAMSGPNLLGSDFSRKYLAITSSLSAFFVVTHSS